MQMQRARSANALGGSAQALTSTTDDTRIVEEGALLQHYLPSGKLKNHRYFWVSVEQGTISWDKKKSSQPNKTEPLLGVRAEPALKSVHR